MAIFLSLSVSLISAFALEPLLQGTQAQAATRRSRTVLLLIAGTGAILWLATLSGLWANDIPSLKNPAVLAVMRRSTHIAFAFLLLSGAALYGVMIRRGWWRWAGVVLIGVFFLDMTTFGGDQNTSPVNPNEYFRRAEPIVRFLHDDGRDELFRVNTRNQFGMLMDRNQGMVDRIATMEGYTPLVLQRALPPYGSDTRMFDLLNAKYVTTADPASGRLALTPHPGYMPRAFVLYDVRTFEREEELLTFIRDSSWNHRTTALLERTPAIPIGPARATSGPTARITAFENNSIALEVETSENGLLVLSEIYYPGWTASVDGAETELLRTDYALRGIAVPAGNHHVEVRFTHPPFVTGAVITSGALALCLGGIAAPLLYRTRSKAKGH
jgi:hypothetical protein